MAALAHQLARLIGPLHRSVLRSARHAADQECEGAATSDSSIEPTSIGVGYVGWRLIRDPLPGVNATVPAIDAADERGMTGSQFAARPGALTIKWR
jgi:hypothetical protein